MPWMTMECILMWAIKIFLLPHHCIASTGMLVGRVCRSSLRCLRALASSAERTDRRIFLTVPIWFLYSGEERTSSLYFHSKSWSMRLTWVRVWILNLLRGLEDPSLYDEFDRWFTGDMTVDRRVQYSQSFFQVIFGHVSMGWLGDEVIIFLISFRVVDLCIYIFLNRHVSVPLQHIHEYFLLISEKQRQYTNSLVQRITYTNTFFWVTYRDNL